MRLPSLFRGGAEGEVLRRLQDLLQELPSVRVGDLGDLFGGAFGDDLATSIPAFGLSVGACKLSSSIVKLRLPAILNLQRSG